MWLVMSVLPSQGRDMPALHIEGRWLCDDKGEHVNLHGFGQTYSPWFNEQGNGWGWGYNVDACLKYNKGLIDKIMAAGWRMNWMRLHMDPHWSNDETLLKQWQNSHPNENYGENHIEAFSETQFKKYLDEVFIPMAEYANAKGLYVVMRPPGVCPEKLSIGDAYQKYLIKVWTIVTSHEKLKNNPLIMFELANEPINMLGSDGQYTSWTDGSFKNTTRYFQTIVDKIREGGANNILWVPGLGYQSQYAGYAKYPIKEQEGGWGIGYAVHCYPGWYGSDSEDEKGSVEQGVVTKGAGYKEFQAGWNNQVGPIAKLAPILITEMDWAPKKYNCSWGKATTGVAGGVGFGANFKYIMDKTENVSWMLFTGPEHLARYKDSAPDGNTFLTDPEACPRPIYRWYKEYGGEDWVFEDTLANRKSRYYADEADEIKLASSSLNGLTLFATDSERESIWYVNSNESSPQNVALGDMSDYEDNPFCWLKFTRVTTSGSSVKGDLYTIQMANSRKENYSLWGKAGYLNTPPGAWCLFALGLNNQYGEDGKNFGLWKVEYHEGSGYTLTNVGLLESGRTTYAYPSAGTPQDQIGYVRLFSKVSLRSLNSIESVDTESARTKSYDLLGRPISTDADYRGFRIVNGRISICR